MNSNQFNSRGGRLQQQPHHMAGMGQQQQQHPQQQQAQQGQQSVQQQQQQQRYPMLPPQFANMSPQQLQQLKQQPQFQAYVRNYMQRQQQLMAQERQRQVSGGGGSGDMAGVGPSKGGMPPQQQMMPPPMGQQQQQQQQLVPQGMSGPGAAGSQMRMSHLNQGGGGGMDGIPPGSNPLQQQQQPSHGMMGGVPGADNGTNFVQRGPGGPVGVPGMNSGGGILPPGVQSNATPGVPNAMPVIGNGPGMNAAMLVQKGGNMTQQHPGIPQQMGPGGMHVPQGPPHMGNALPQVPPPIVLPPSIVNAIPEDMRKLKGVDEALSKIPFELMSSTKEWSKKLGEANEDPSTDLRIYEDVITKDTEFFPKLTAQANKNRILVDDMTRDIKNYSAIKQLRVNAINLSSKRHFNNSIWGEGYQGYGNGITNTATTLLLPERDATDREINEAVAKLEHSLVPVRLEFDQERDKFKLRDTFLWDLNEKYLSAEEFVSMLIEDYKFIPKHYFETIVRSIKEQVNDYYRKPSKCLGELRIPIKLDITINNTQLTDQFEWDILNYNEKDPEEFASIMCDEMALPGEFTTAIAHTIREQAQLYHKALHLVGYSFDGSAVQEDEIRNHILPSLRFVANDYKYVDEFFSVLRNPQSVGDYSPALVKLTQLEVERLDKEIERDSRRKRRHNIGNLDESLNSSSVSLNGFGANGGGGISSLSSRGTLSRRTALHAARVGGHSLPDLIDLPKTFRTPAPSSVLPGAVDLGTPDIYSYLETHVIKSHVPNPNYEPPKPKNFSVRIDNSDDAFIVRIKLAPERFPGYVRRPSYDSDPDLDSSDY